MSTFKLTVGADPEFFLRCRTTHRKVSAHNMVPGTKKNPSPLPNGGYVQVDGVAVEFNTPPAETADQFADAVRSCLSDIRKMIPNKYEFLFVPAVMFGPKYFEGLPEENKELGCDPDFDAYTGTMNPIPKPSHHGFRTASGHLHIGWGSGLEGNAHNGDCIYFIKKLDHEFQTYVFQRISHPDKALENRRRELYGKSGAYRPKSYGVEYRTPSNAWLGMPREMHKFIFNSVAHVWRKETGVVSRPPMPPPGRMDYGYRLGM